MVKIPNVIAISFFGGHQLRIACGAGAIPQSPCGNRTTCFDSSLVQRQVELVQSLSAGREEGNLSTTCANGWCLCLPWDPCWTDDWPSKPTVPNPTEWEWNTVVSSNVMGNCEVTKCKPPDPSCESLTLEQHCQANGMACIDGVGTDMVCGDMSTFEAIPDGTMETTHCKYSEVGREACCNKDEVCVAGNGQKECCGAGHFCANAFMTAALSLQQTDASQIAPPTPLHGAANWLPDSPCCLPGLLTEVMPPILGFLQQGGCRINHPHIRPGYTGPIICTCPNDDEVVEGILQKCFCKPEIQQTRNSPFSWKYGHSCITEKPCVGFVKGIGGPINKGIKDWMGSLYEGEGKYRLTAHCCGRDDQVITPNGVTAPDAVCIAVNPVKLPDGPVLAQESQEDGATRGLPRTIGGGLPWTPEGGIVITPLSSRDPIVVTRKVQCRSSKRVCFTIRTPKLIVSGRRRIWGSHKWVTEEKRHCLGTNSKSCSKASLLQGDDLPAAEHDDEGDLPQEYDDEHVVEVIRTDKVEDEGHHLMKCSSQDDCLAACAMELGATVCDAQRDHIFCELDASSDEKTCGLVHFLRNGTRIPTNQTNPSA